MNNKVLLGNWGFSFSDPIIAKQHQQLARSFPSVLKSSYFLDYDGQRKHYHQIPPLSTNNIGWVDLYPFILYDTAIMDVNCYKYIIEASNQERYSFPYIN